jgi:hypothetical protein
LVIWVPAPGASSKSLIFLSEPVDKGMQENKMKEWTSMHGHHLLGSINHEKFIHDSFYVM